MLDPVKFNQITQDACKQTVLDYMDDSKQVQIKSVKDSFQFEEVIGPSIEVSGEKIHYSFILQYLPEQNLKYIDLLSQKYPFIDESEVPELDILDYLGEFLNILCGKVNRELESLDKNLNIEIPYFSYGIEALESETVQSFECQFGELNFKLHSIF